MKLTQQEKAALDSLDMSKILGTPEQRVELCLIMSVRYMRQRNVLSQAMEKIRAALNCHDRTDTEQEVFAIANKALLDTTEGAG